MGTIYDPPTNRKEEQVFKKLSPILVIMALLLGAVPASAHTLWINAYASHAHAPGHVLACIGWGHSLPMDDLFTELNLESYNLVNPEMERPPCPCPR